MDLIGSINCIENRFGGRKPDSGRRKPAQGAPNNEAAHDQGHQPDTRHSAADNEARLGQKVDTIA